MGKIARYTGNLLAFAANATGLNRTVFGDTTQSDTLDDNVNADFLAGWEIVGVNENPTKQDFNALAFTATQLAAYIHQMGVAEWDAVQEYHSGSLCQSGGATYISASDTNVGNDPTSDDGTNWAQAAQTQINTLAKLRTQEPIAGRRVYLKARTTEGDGGEGVFRAVTTDVSADVTRDTASGLYVAPDSDPTGASGAWVRDYAGPINALWFGVPRDGVTSATASLNAFFQQLRYAAAAAALVDTRHLLIPSGDYFIDGNGVDLTDIRFTSFAEEGRGWISAYGVRFLGNTTGKKTVDMIRSLGIGIEGLAIVGDAVNTPDIGLQYGRAASGESSDRILLQDVTTAGVFDFTGAYNLASEREHLADCQFRNENLGAGTYAYVLDGTNEFGATSDHYTITIPIDTPQSNLSHLYEQTTFAKASGSVNGPIYMSRFGRVDMVACYALAYAGYAVTINTDGTSLQDNKFNLHCETAGLVGCVYFDSSTASADMEGFTWIENNNHASTAVFTAAPGVSVTLSKADIHIGGYGTIPSTGLFDSDADFKVRGSISIPIAAGATLGTPLDFVGTLLVPNSAGADLIYPLGTQRVLAEDTQAEIVKGTIRHYSASDLAPTAPALASKDLVKTENGGVFFGTDSANNTSMSWGDSSTETEEWRLQAFSSNTALRFQRSDGVGGWDTSLAFRPVGTIGLPQLAADPAGVDSSNGDMYYNTTTNKGRLYEASVWRDI